MCILHIYIEYYIDINIFRFQYGLVIKMWFQGKFALSNSAVRIIIFMIIAVARTIHDVCINNCPTSP